METKELGISRRRNSTASALEQVEVVLDAPETDAEKYWHLLGRHDAFGLNAAFATAAWAANLERIHESKLYLKQERDWDTWCRKHAPFARPKCMEMIRDWKEFGKWGFAARELLHLNRQSLRALDASFTDAGEILIAGEKHSLKTKEGIESAKLAIMAIQERTQKAEQAVSDAEQQLEKAKERARNAEEAAKKAREELLARNKQAEQFWKHADEDHRFMLDVQQSIEFQLVRLRTFSKRTLSTENQERLVALVEYLWAQVHMVCERVRAQYGIGLLAMRPAETLEVEDLTPNKRDLVNEYFSQHPLTPLKK